MAWFRLETFAQRLEPSYSGFFFSLGVALLVWIVVEAVYRRYFHPLAKIPGPLLPAITRYYLWYYTIVQEGQFYKKIEEMHRKYGPIVRIAPNEIHLSEPNDHDVIFAMGTQFTKDWPFYRGLGLDISFTTPSNELHRRRRAPLNAFFSRRSVLDLEGLVQATARKLCDRIAAGVSRTGGSVDLGAAMRALSVDVITKYAFDESWGQLDREDLGVWWSDMVRDLSTMMLHFQQWPLLQKVLMSLPEWVGAATDKSMAAMFASQQRVRRDVLKTQKQIDAGATSERRTILHDLLSSDSSLYDVPVQEYCMGEAFALLTAAADTTGNAMGLAAFNVVSNRDVYTKLRSELLDAFPDLEEDMPFTKLERLPYLTGVVKEASRLSYGVLTRLARTAPEGGAIFQGHFIPQGTTVSMSSWILHRREDVFPDPDVFDPMRWVKPHEELREQERCFVPFSRGTRGCLGQNLAMCEMFVALATLFRKFEALEPYECGPDDMVYVEAFSAFHPRKARSFRIVEKK